MHNVHVYIGMCSVYVSGASRHSFDTLHHIEIQRTGARGLNVALWLDGRTKVLSARNICMVQSCISCRVFVQGCSPKLRMLQAVVVSESVQMHWEMHAQAHSGQYCTQHNMYNIFVEVTL